MRPFALYGASKAALDRFAAGIAPDLAATGIAVTTITPGAFVETPGTAAIDMSDAADLGRIDVDRVGAAVAWLAAAPRRSEEHTSELQSLMRISYAVFCLNKKKKQDQD